MAFASDSCRIENPICNGVFLSGRSKASDRTAERTAIDSQRLQTAGDANVHFLDGGALLGDSLYEECTVDGVHPNDLGFLRIAESLEPVILNLLNRKGVLPMHACLNRLMR
ncbi:SGNH/GDSL hydrolase family protein [Paenibacillus agaridevorans]|uniref:SGNH/GDSL hydrolase family protein n=1 Tax=Paenibacillus agaridevorans TaxID=171404 RepID=UPI000D590F75